MKIRWRTRLAVVGWHGQAQRGHVQGGPTHARAFGLGMPREKRKNFLGNGSSLISEASTERQRIRDRLWGQHILITGSTGFLAKAFVEKLLRSVDTIGGIHLLIRIRSDGQTAQQRVTREVLRSRAFDRLRASMGEGFARLCDEKIHVVRGDLTRERLGMDPADYDALTRRITLIVNSAATVTFDERLDLAVELNTLGPSRLLRLAVDCGDVPFMHVSTSYVCGARTGLIVEDFSAPERARETLPLYGDSSDFDLDGLIQSMQAQTRELRHRFGADSEMCRRELIDGGMRRARSNGWNDTYTFTKWLGEQRLVRDRGRVPLVIFRPAIIESSFAEPMPGWIDGLRMADPIIVAYGKGKLSEFPARADVPIDLIPVDFVANAMIATLPVGEGWSDGLAVYHCASSACKPLTVVRLRDALERAFRKRPMNDDDGRPVRAGRLRIVEQGSFARLWRRKQRRVALLQRLFHAIGIRGRRYRRLAALARQIDQVIYLGKIYSPYTHLDCRFSVDALAAASSRLHPKDRKEFAFDVGEMDWDEYLINRHVPGLRAFVLAAGGEPTPRILGAQTSDQGGAGAAIDALGGGNLFDVLVRAAGRFGEKPALQVRRGGRWIRYTYQDLVDATGSVMQRFIDRGLQPGDRVAITGESAPEWGVTFFAAMRAGLTAVPLDPQLPPADAWAAARFAEAKLMCATPATLGGLEAARSEGDPELVAMREPFVPKPGATRDTVPDPVPVDDTAVASILFTSGTTVSPKAVRLTHANLIANASSLVRVHAVGTSDQLLSVLPMYHAFEFTGGFIVPLACGATITYVDQLKASSITEAMQSTGTTVMLVVPRLLRMFNDSINHAVAASGSIKRRLFRALRGLSALTGGRFARQLFRSIHQKFGGNLRMFVCGGSRLDPELFDAFRTYGFEVYEGYGLTETAPVLSVNPPHRAVRGSVGLPVPGVELSLRHQNLEGVGEVWVKGANVMAGYLKNDQATQEILCQGRLRTGDLGRLDENGYLYLTGRSTDLIVTSAGKNVYPDEVEARYQDLPYVKELCVFGMSSEDGLGDTVHAVIVIDDDAALHHDRSSTEREIRSAVTSVGESVPDHQRITTLHFWQRELPKTSILKAKRGLIREAVRAERAATVLGDDVDRLPTTVCAAEAGSPTDQEREKLQIVQRILTRQSSQRPESITPDMHLHLDLGIDSIGKIDVLGGLEAQYRLTIDGETAAGIARVSDLLKLIGDRRPKPGAAKWAAPRLREADDRMDSPVSNGATSASLAPMRWLVRGGISAFMNTYVRVRVVGRANIPAGGAFIFAPNHSSHLDSPAVLTAVGGCRRVWVAGAEDYFFNSPLKRLLFGRLLDTIPFDRQADGLSGLRRCGEALRRGEGLLMFPEGTRSTTGELHAFKIGVAVLALDRNVPIIPIYIDRAFELLPKGSRFVRPGTITVTFAKPVYPPKLTDDADRYAAFRDLAEQVETAVAQLADRALS